MSHPKLPTHQMHRKIQPSRHARWQIALVILAAALLVGCGDPPPPELAEQPMGTLPAWAFTNERGRPIGTKELAGEPYAVNFLFTSCPTSCPPLAQATAKLQAMMGEWRKTGGPRLVSISVDPASDTPEALRTFARKYGAKASLWTFARADYATMEKLVVEGFYQPIVRKDRKPGTPVAAIADTPTPVDTAHGIRFVLIDGMGRMRALYEKDDASLAKLDHALRWLSEHPGK